jgi:hypothetical protein
VQTVYKFPAVSMRANKGGQSLRVGAGQRQRVQQPGRGVTVQVGRGQADVVLGQQRPHPGLDRSGQLAAVMAPGETLLAFDFGRFDDRRGVTAFASKHAFYFIFNGGVHVRVRRAYPD